MSDQKCGNAIWGKGSIGNPPIGHCSLKKGHDGRCMILVETREHATSQTELDLDLTDSDWAWKPGRDIPNYIR